MEIVCSSFFKLGKLNDDQIFLIRNSKHSHLDEVFY